MGSSNTLIMGSEKNIISYEPTVVLVNDMGEVEFIGEAAAAVVFDERVMQSTPPVVAGRLASEEAAYQFLLVMLQKLGLKGIQRFLPPFITFTVPVDFSLRDQYVWKKLGKHLGIHCQFIPSVVGIANAFPQHSVKNSRIVADFGGGKLDIAVVEYGKIVTADSFFESGEILDNLIQLHIFTAHHLAVTRSDAKLIKDSLPIFTEGKPSSVVVRGKDSDSGKVVTLKVTRADMLPILEAWVERVAFFITHFIHGLPPKCIPILEQSGISLAGGLSQMPGLVEELEQRIPAKITLISRPQVASCIGVVNLLQSNEYL